MKPEDTLDFNIRWTWLNISRYYNDAAAKYGESMSVGMVLLNIDQENGTPSTQLGPKMGMEPTSLSRTLKNMEDSGLIKRKADKTDGRKAIVHITAKGAKKRDVAKNIVLEFNNNILNQLSEEETQTFIKVLNTINEQIKE
ncbi:MAG: MarR family transcriptional regulator [Rhodobacteraceae bacterium]|nr:MarR family transcriptional regulator [Paracoccaceae bacterium]